MEGLPRLLGEGCDRVTDEDSASARDSVIELDRVAKVYDGVAAVHQSTFAIRRGEFFSMLGPSGCGKTTTLRMIAGFEAPTSGEIRLEGVDVSNTPPYKRNVNTVFQQYALFPHMNVFDNIAFGPRTKRLPKAEVNERAGKMLEIVRLEGFAKRKAHQLSGGQAQRVALARALVNYPSALLLDEPLAALDLKLRQTMQLELKRIQREVGITFIFVTHDQEEALTMSDRIAVMSDGIVEQIGTPEEIYHRPASVFVAGFIGSANLFPATTIDERTATVTGQQMGVGSSAGSITPGGPSTLMVRPERITVSLEPPVGTRNGVQAAVTDLTFQGPVVRCELTTTDGTTAVAYLGGDDKLPMLTPGQTVWATWDVDAARLLPARGQSLIETTDDAI